MNIKATIASLIAAVAGIALLLVYMQRFEAETSGGARVPVLTAAQDIPLGTVLTADMLGQRLLPAAYVEQRHIRAKDSEQVIGAPVSMTVKVGESLLWSDLATMQTDRRELASLVQRGMRAMTLASSGASTMLIRPGDRVDVLFTNSTQLGGQGDDGASTVTLLQNVLVLAVAGDTGGPAKGKRGRRTRGTTLSLTPEQAQLLTHARTQGLLELVVRNTEDILVLSDLPKTSRADIVDAERRSRFVRRPRTQSPAVEIDHVQ